MVGWYGGLVRADSVERCGFGWVDGKQCLEAGEVEHVLGDAAGWGDDGELFAGRFLGAVVGGEEGVNHA